MSFRMLLKLQSWWVSLLGVWHCHFQHHAMSPLPGPTLPPPELAPLPRYRTIGPSRTITHIAGVKFLIPGERCNKYHAAAFRRASSRSWWDHRHLRSAICVIFHEGPTVLNSAVIPLLSEVCAIGYHFFRRLLIELSHMWARSYKLHKPFLAYISRSTSNSLDVHTLVFTRLVLWCPISSLTLIRRRLTCL